MDKVKEKLERNGAPVTQRDVFVRSGGKLIKVAHQDCLFAEAQGNYTKVVTLNSAIFTKLSFSAFIALLPDELFIRVHRSYLINKDMVSHIEGNRVFIGQNEIPIASNYRDSFLKSFGLKSH